MAKLTTRDEDVRRITPDAGKVNTISTAKELEERLATLGHILAGIEHDTQKPEAYRVLQTLESVATLHERLSAARLEYQHCLSSLTDDVLGGQLEGSMLTLPIQATVRGTQTQISIAFLMSRWAEVQSGIERVRSDALAWLSVELGILSFLIAFLPLCLP